MVLDLCGRFEVTATVRKLSPWCAGKRRQAAGVLCGEDSGPYLTELPGCLENKYLFDLACFSKPLLSRGVRTPAFKRNTPFLCLRHPADECPGLLSFLKGFSSSSSCWCLEKPDERMES